MKKKRASSSFDCPHCGQPVRISAKSCPHCGSDEDTGWADDYESEYEADDFDYDEYIEREFPDRSDSLVSSRQKKWRTWIIVLLLVSMILSAFMLF